MDNTENSIDSNNNQQFSKGVIEDEIFIGQYEGDPEEDLFKYYLSNNLYEIETLINSKIINIFPKLQEVNWEINTNGLAKKVKDMMNKLNKKYSMTIFYDRNDKNIRHIAINKRTDNEWFFYGGVIIANEYFSYEEVGAY